MKGAYELTVQNKRIHYQFTIKRNITVIRGDSATGKTKLLEMIETYSLNGISSGIDLKCTVPCIVLHGGDWKQRLSYTHNSIVFIDECNDFIRREEFASEVKRSDNYFVLVTRDDLPNLSYSVEEIYGIRMSKQYAGLKKTYNEFYQIYGEYEKVFNEETDFLLVEDSNSGFEFFKFILNDNIKCESSNGKSNIYKFLLGYNAEDKCIVIADGAAFGAEMDRIIQLIESGRPIALYLPESFEWIILKSDILDDKEVRKILEHPEQFIDSEKYFSWEQYFTKLLVSKSDGTYLKYQKDFINKAYLQDKIVNKIIQVLPLKIRMIFKSNNSSPDD